MTPEPGWYPDPFDPSRDRWWNGTAWTENTQAGPQTPDPYATARVEPVPAGGDYVSQLDDDTDPLPDYEVLASVEEGTKGNAANPPSNYDTPAPPIAAEWGDEGEPGSGGSGGKKKLAKILGVLGIVFGLLLVSGTAAAFFLFNGRGPQVEDVMPSNTALMARVDLDPSLSQKANILRLISRFPQLNSANIGEETAPQEALLDALSQNGSGQDPFLTDAKQWVGSRLGIGVIPSGSTFSPVVVVSVKDEAQLDSFMSKHASELFYSTKDGFAVISDSQEAVSTVLSSESSLADNQSFQASREQLNLDAVALIWNDVSQAQAIQEALNPGSLSTGLGDLSLPEPEFDAAGYFMLGVAAEPDAIRVAAVTESFTLADAPSINLGVSGDGLASLPDETLGAVSLAAPAGILEDIFDYAAQSDASFSDMLDSGLAEYGLDRETLFGFVGDQVSLVVLPNQIDGDPIGALAIKGQDLEPREVEKVLAEITKREELLAEVTNGGEAAVYPFEGTTYILPTEHLELLKSYLDNSGSLGDTEAFKRAFPIGSAGFISAYLGDQGVAALREGADEELLDQLLSVGITAQVSPDSPGDSRTEIVVAFR